VLFGLAESGEDCLLSTDTVVEASGEGVDVMTVTMVWTVLFVEWDSVDPFSDGSTVCVSSESRKVEDVTVNAMTAT
jgi:hypothetical protein